MDLIEKFEKHRNELKSMCKCNNNRLWSVSEEIEYGSTCEYCEAIDDCERRFERIKILNQALTIVDCATDSEFYDIKKWSRRFDRYHWGNLAADIEDEGWSPGQGVIDCEQWTWRVSFLKEAQSFCELTGYGVEDKNNEQLNKILNKIK